MTSFSILNFIDETTFFDENNLFNDQSFNILNLDFYLSCWNVTELNFLNISSWKTLHTHFLLNFIHQMENNNLYNNVENITAIYHYSIPNTKLSYPEPFIASPSFMHSDLWFVHILIYQYWLWFVFVFIIVFFFITFICTIRWCNMRVRPRRETRGVSRSKCGDLITACVPVTWATSIIVNESTDAIDYYDGFGTTELVVGIRAYQWGWEYYYPKDIDLNYNIKSNYSAFIGNSLKYSRTSGLNVKANNLWKFYQNKNTDQIITPAHALVLPFDNYKLFNFLNFNDMGAQSNLESNSFKKVRMFSKTLNTDLFFIPNNFSTKYKNFSNLFVDTNYLADSYLYGTKRQHNFFSINTTLNNQTTLLNLKSINKIINFNFKNNLDYTKKSNTIQKFNFFKKINNTNTSNLGLKINKIVSFFNNSQELNSFNNFTSYNNLLNLINDNTEKKHIHYIIYKMFNLKFNKKNFYHSTNFNKLNLFEDSSIFKQNSKFNNFFSNNNLSNKQINFFAQTSQYRLNDRFTRNFINNTPNVSNFNYSLEFNALNNYLNSNFKNFGLSNTLFNNFFKAKWVELSSTIRFANAKTNAEYPYSPIMTNNPISGLIDYDSYKRTDDIDDKSAIILQGKEENVSSATLTMYWNTFFVNTNFDLRILSNNIYHNIHKFFYLPTFGFFYDYDFRNWQMLQFLEDSVWESICSAYTNEEYASLSNDFYEYEYFRKWMNLYNKTDRMFIFEERVANLPFLKDSSINEDYYSGTLYLEDFTNSLNLVSLKDFSIYPLFAINNNIEDSYEVFKNTNYLFNLANKIFFLNSEFGIHPQHSFFVFDMFRADIDEFSWFFDDNNFKKFNLNKNFNNQNSRLKYFIFDLQAVLSINDKFMDLWHQYYLNLNTEFFFDNDITNSNKLNRYISYLNLRAPAKSSVVTFNALQKVFRTRFDENRSHAKLEDLSYSYTKQPFISSARSNYENLLGKTKNNFFKNNFFKNNFKTFINNFYEITTSLNFYFFDFPFLLALKSDASRYMWFDWFSKWGFYEIQPSSSSRYAIYGAPYLTKNFEFSGEKGEILNESENYLLRIARARRNYITNWTFTPYFYARNNAWFKTNLINEIIDLELNDLIRTQNILNSMNWYWMKLKFINFDTYQFFPSISSVNSYTKTGWKPKHSIQSYYYSAANLIDILTKREYLYRELFAVQHKIVNLPNFLTNNPSNPLINEIKSSFLFVDPIIFNNEYSKNTSQESLNFFNFIILKTFLNTTNTFINFKFVTNLLFHYLVQDDYAINLNNNSELYKNQYRPMRKGVSNMIRLHATGAVAMPIELRLQILASSKDVIHSWAIPSAGIKIDCVPGYSSHKVMIFLVSGIFWGQCMEVCGRYHHWMPIVIYFMKRDLFFLWCTHFVFLSGSNNIWTINDRQFVNYVRLASFDKYSWLTELNA